MVRTGTKRGEMKFFLAEIRQGRVLTEKKPKVLVAFDDNQ